MADPFTDLPGIGPKTAKNLRNAGYSSLSKIAEANPSRLAFKVDGVGETTARRIINAAGGDVEPPQTDEPEDDEPEIIEEYKPIYERIEQTAPAEIERDILSGASEFTTGSVEKPTEEQAISPFTVDVEGPKQRSLEKIHENRSERAQDVDEQQNAPVTTDEEKWIQNKNRHDFPGVDTIPRERQQGRAERAAALAQEQGALDEVQQKGNAKNLRGKFSPEGSSTYGSDKDVVRVQNTAEQPERTLAHEVGHAFDWASSGKGHSFAHRLFGENTFDVTVIDEPDEEPDELRDQARQVSKMARGPFDGQRGYRNKTEELAADMLGQAMINPRATKREAPELFDRLTDLAGREGFAEAIPEPLESDPEPRGFLE